jgi:hypothetical protein
MSNIFMNLPDASTKTQIPPTTPITPTTPAASSNPFMNVGAPAPTTPAPVPGGQVGVGIAKGALGTMNDLNDMAKPVTNLVDKGENYIATGIANHITAPLIAKLTGKNFTPTSTDQNLQEIKNQDNSINNFSNEKAQTHNLQQDIGKGIERVLEVAIPETKGTKAVDLIKTSARYAPGIIKAVGSGALNFADSALHKGSATENTIMGVASALAGPAFNAATKVGGSTLKALGGALSGKGSKVIDTIIENPRAALQGMNQEGIDTLKQNSEAVHKVANSFYKGAKNEFEATLNSIKNKVGPINSDLVNSKVSKILEDNNISYTYKDGIPKVDLSGFAGDNKAVLQKTFDLIKGKTNDTVDGLENIAQIINKQARNTSSPEIKAILGNMSKAVRSAYTDQMEKLGFKKEANIASNYAKAMDKLDTYDKVFGTDARSSILKESTQTDIMNKVKGLLGGDRTIDISKLKDMAENVDLGKVTGNARTAADILGREAGRQMKEGVSRASASIGDLTANAIHALLPSKTIGKIAAGASIAKSEMQPVLDWVASHPEIGSAAKQTVLQFLHSLTNE